MVHCVPHLPRSKAARVKNAELNPIQSPTSHRFEQANVRKSKMLPPDETVCTDLHDFWPPQPATGLSVPQARIVLTPH